jgi:hypothetical protein
MTTPEDAAAIAKDAAATPIDAVATPAAAPALIKDAVTTPKAAPVLIKDAVTTPKAAPALTKDAMAIAKDASATVTDAMAFFGVFRPFSPESIIVYVCEVMKGRGKIWMLAAVMAMITLVSISSFGQITFQKTYGSVYPDYGYSVQQTSDSGYILVGYTTSFVTGRVSTYLIKTDERGDTLWTKIYGGIIHNEGSSVDQTTDGGFIIAGDTTYGTSNGDIYLIKTTANGTPLWAKTYGGPGNDKASMVRQTTDGGYAILGTYNYSNGPSDVYLIKTSNNGDTLWTKTYGGAGQDYGWSLQQTTDGGYIIASQTGSFGTGVDDFYLIKITANGDTLWTKTFGGTTDDGGWTVRQTSDGGYIVAGYTASFGAGGYDVYLIKTDVTGELVWAKTYGGSGNDVAETVQQTTDGGYIISGGTYSFGSGGEDVYLIKTNSNGDTLWTRAFGSIYGEHGFSAEQTLDGGYVVAGYTLGGGAGYADLYLIKTDANGNCGCNQKNTATILTTPITIATRPASIVSFSPTVVTSQTVSVTSGAIVNTFCFVGITEVESQQWIINIFPNPSSGIFFINNSIKEEITSATVYNYLGEEIFSSIRGESAIDITKAAKGIYFYSVTLRDGTITKGKLVKE